MPRVVIVDVPHHVTQRGNARQVILASDADRIIYLELLREYSQLYALSLLGYCLMSNHIHLIVVPRRPEALSHSLRQAYCWKKPVNGPSVPMFPVLGIVAAFYS
jgi:REP-associated tyrosine transposase